MTAETGPPDGPVIAFHEAPFFITDLYLPAFITVLAAVPLLGLPVSWALHPEKWPPDMAAMVIWLAGAILLGRFIVAPMAATWLRVKHGGRAGLRVAEGDEYLEVAFFVGEQACRVQRFAYADITGCGTDRFQVTATGSYELRPYVAIRGMVRDSVKTPIPLAILWDARQLLPYESHSIAVDIDRVIRRHCDLPEPEIPLAIIAEEKEQELLRDTAKLVEQLGHDRAVRQTRFLGQDWPRIGLAGTATVLLCVFWLDGEMHLRWDDGSDWLVVGIVFYGFYKLAGAFLKAWRERPRDE